jgi:hypothetical protein
MITTCRVKPTLHTPLFNSAIIKQNSIHPLFQQELLSD